jgi:hypothetical protein
MLTRLSVGSGRARCAPMLFLPMRRNPFLSWLMLGKRTRARENVQHYQWDFQAAG